MATTSAEPAIALCDVVRRFGPVTALDGSARARPRPYGSAPVFWPPTVAASACSGATRSRPVPRQRLSLARVLLTDPQVLLLDEPTAALEGLLLTLVTDRELATAKLLRAWLPAVALGLVGAVVYALVVNLTLAGSVAGLVVAQATGVILLSLWALAAMGLVAALLAGGLLRSATGALSRPKLGPRLG